MKVMSFHLMPYADLDLSRPVIATRKVELLRGHARLVTAQSVQVGERRLSASAIVLATGEGVERDMRECTRELAFD